jgi:hypothetical protein
MSAPRKLESHREAIDPQLESYELKLRPATARVHLHLHLPKKRDLRLTIDAQVGNGRPISHHELEILPAPQVPRPRRWVSRFWNWFTGLKGFFRNRSSSRKLAAVSVKKAPGLATWLFVGAMTVYLGTRLISLPSYPIYFFTDEAVQTVLAQDFVRDHFRNYDKDFLPTYFVNGNQYNLSTSVYIQVIPYLLFGKSIWVTRGTAVLTTLMAAVAVGLILKNIFRSRYYWLATLFLSITPAWFLHSRTAFETTLATSFFAMFLYFYLMYRQQDHHYLYGATVMGALCFYSYSPAQMVMLVIALALWVSDIKYHWRNRKTVLINLGVLVLLFVPYIRFLIQHGGENAKHLLILQSYWVSNLPLWQKLLQFLRQYLQGLNPLYWFFPNTLDFSRHLMLNYGHISRFVLPFSALGFGYSLWNVRKPAYRAVLLTVLAAPAGAALVELGITRALFMVVPIAVLTAIGVSLLFFWLEKIRIPALVLAIVGFTSLVGANIYMLSDTLANGPLWYQQYDLAGMQYGSRQLFGEIRQYLAIHPGVKLIVSPSWANGTDVIARFFFNDPLPFALGDVEGWLHDILPLDDQTVFVMIPHELDQAVNSGKFKDIYIDQDWTIDYPNGDPGFYFVHLAYVDDIDRIMAEERAQRKILQEGITQLPDGQVVTVQYSRLDMGDLKALFDGNVNSITRTEEANPMKIYVTFQPQRLVQGVTVRVGGVPTRLTVRVYRQGQSDPQVFVVEKPETADPRDVRVDFAGRIQATRIEIEVLSTRDKEPAHVHVWEVTFW